MSQDTPDKIADVLKSLWRLEISLRKAALNCIIFKKTTAAAHFAEARHHFDEIKSAFRNNAPPAHPPTIQE